MIPFFLTVRNVVICVHFITPLYVTCVPCTGPSHPTGSDILLGCPPYPTLVSISWAALHYYIGTLLTPPGPWNSLWTNFLPHADSLFISFGLWFSPLGLRLSLSPHIDHLMVLVLNCPAMEKVRDGEVLRGQKKHMWGSCSKQNDYGWNHSLLTACGHVSTPIWSLSSTFRACARLETSMNQLSLGSSFISLFSDSQRFLMFSFINFIMPLKFLLIMCPVYLWVGNEKNFICISLAHHVAELPLNTTFKHLFFCQIYVITF